jgi:hypothetical protein
MKLGSGTRAYIFRSDISPSEKAYFTTDLWTGRPIRWSEDAWKLIRERRATPGNANRLINVDFVISDRPYGDMAIEQWRKIGIDRNADFDFAPLNPIDPRLACVRG